MLCGPDTPLPGQCKDACAHAHGSVICDGPKLETAQRPSAAEEMNRISTQKKATQ